MEIEKVKEIKEKLQEEISIATSFGDKLRRVPTTDLQDVLTLINDLESENENLVKALEDMPIPFMGCMLENQLLSDIGKEKNGEIKALKDRIAELEKKNDEQYKRIMELEQDLVHADENVFYRECDVALQENKIKTEALKQFAERLKEKIYSLWSGRQLGELLCDIDETLKEFIDG